MPRRSGGSYVLREGKPVLVSRSGPGGNVPPDGTFPLDKSEQVSQVPPSDSLPEFIEKPSAAIETRSAPNVKKDKSDAHTPEDAPGRT